MPKNAKINPITEYFDISFFENEKLAPLNSDVREGKEAKPYYYMTSQGRVFTMAKNHFRELHPRENKQGYYRFSVVNTDNSMSTISLHRAVLSTFDPNPDMYKLQINHKDGIKSNNNLDNLEWCTNKENMHHALKNQLIKNLTDDELTQIITLIKRGCTDFEISQQSSATEATVMSIRLKQLYKERTDALGYTQVVKHVLDDLPDEIFIKVIELAKAGYSDSEIGKLLGISKNTTANIRKCISQYKKKFERLHLSPVLHGAPHHPDQTFINIVNLHNKGYSNKQIAIKLNEPISFVTSVVYMRSNYRKKLQKLGLILK